MRDEGLRTLKATPAEAAVNYLLERVRVDADLRYLMLDTQAFGLLCEAEAARTGAGVDEVRRHYATLAERCRADKPRLVELQELAAQAAEVCRRHLLHASPWGADLVDMLDRMS